MVSWECQLTRYVVVVFEFSLPLSLCHCCCSEDGHRSRSQLDSLETNKQQLLRGFHEWRHACIDKSHPVLSWFESTNNIFFLLLDVPGLGVVIDLGMALTPFPFKIGWDSNPQNLPIMSRVSFSSDILSLSTNTCLKILYPSLLRLRYAAPFTKNFSVKQMGSISSTFYVQLLRLQIPKA